MKPLKPADLKWHGKHFTFNPRFYYCHFHLQVQTRYVEASKGVKPQEIPVLEDLENGLVT